MERDPGTRGPGRTAASPPPARLHGAEGTAYVLRRGWTAQHGGRPGRAPGGTRPVPRLALEEGRIRVYQGAAPPARGATEGPVYRSEGGETAVPTGLVFVRFREGVRAAERRAELVTAGYLVDALPPWAPEAVWVRARRGGIGEALRGLARLRRLRGVEVVEPEVLTLRARR